MLRTEAVRNCLAVAAVVMLLATPAQAQDGPELPCENCPDFHELMQYPASGIWFNPEQSGTGFMLDVQDGVVAGYYMIYNQDGDPEWLMFSGALEANEDEDNDARWILETELLRFAGGACLNCAHQPFEEVSAVATLRMEFPWRGYGRFSVDEGPVQNIVPMAYAASIVSGLFEPHSNFVFPSPGESEHGSPTAPPLSTFSPRERWMFVFNHRTGVGGWNYYMLPVTLGGSETWEVNEDGSLSIPMGAYLGSEFDVQWGELTCWADSDSGPMCRIDLDPSTVGSRIPGYFSARPYYVAPGNITHDRIEAQREGTGTTLIGYRLDYN